VNIALTHNRVIKKSALMSYHIAGVIAVLR